MSDFDSALKVRSAVGDLAVKVTDSSNVVINPAKEDGNLASIVTNTSALETTLVAQSAKFPSTVGQKTGANSFAVVLASDQTAIPVTITGGGTDKVNIVDQNTGSAVAGNALSSHSYTGLVANSVIQRIIAAASGRCKVEVWFGTTGSEALKMVKFLTAANPNADFVFDDGLQFDNTKTLIVKRTNLDNQAQDLYSTVLGYQP